MTGEEITHTSADISPTGYRFFLSRVWDDTGTLVVWCMLNPSIADDTIDDPTVRKITEISKRHGYGGLAVVNIFGVRSTEPKQLRSLNTEGYEIWGGREMVLVRERAFAEAEAIVVGWGNHDLRWTGFEPGDTLKQVMATGKPVLCCGTNKNGTPKHPCYLANDTKLVPFSAS